MALYNRAAVGALTLLLSGCAHAPAEAETTPDIKAQQLRLNPIFQGDVVLQREKPVRIYGLAAANKQIRARLDNHVVETISTADGHWKVEFPRQLAGTTATLEVASENGEFLEPTVVTFGDIWVCSGQSNMDLPVRKAANPDRVLEESARRDIRILKVPRNSSAARSPQLTQNISWSRASKDNLSEFSSACWHMGQELSSTLNVPIGLIHSAWGGSMLQDWMPKDSLENIEGYAQSLSLLDQFAANPNEAIQSMSQQTEQWAESVDVGSGGTEPWHTAIENDSNWSTVELPGFWERSGIPNLRSFDGIMWYRTSVQLTEQDARGDATLFAGRIDERDTVWINGVKIGTTVSRLSERQYEIPAAVLRPGENTITIRVIDHMGSGGIRAGRNGLSLRTHDQTTFDLSGVWNYRQGISRREWRESPPFIPWASPRGITTLYNGMIAPITDFQIKGVAWYQGESNTREAELYASLLPHWQSSWRRAFGDDTLPFVVVQLPNFGARSSSPQDSAWANLREVQREFSNTDVYTGLAVTIDLGVVDDIHPSHKSEAGRRMGLEALRVGYERSVATSPQPMEAIMKDGDIIVQFDPASGPLDIIGGHTALGFEVCSSREECRFVDAHVSGSTAVISDVSSQSTEVRYAWQNAPLVNVYSTKGMPMTPFRIEITR